MYVFTRHPPIPWATNSKYARYVARQSEIYTNPAGFSIKKTTCFGKNLFAF